MKSLIVAILALSLCATTPANLAHREPNHLNCGSNYNYHDEIVDCEIKPEEYIFDDLNIPLSTQATTTYNTYMEAYFRALTTNMGENQKGSCGYVALGELLSYYDSFLDDNIIPEKYDVASTGTGTDMISRAVSPGIKNDVVTSSEYSPYASSISKLSAKDYYTIMSGKAETSLHAKLITIGKSLNYYKNDDDANPCGTNYSNREKILKKYFSEIGLSEDLYTIKTYSSSSSNDVKNFIKENIKNGNPVLTSVYNSGSSSGHAVICYDYDNTNIYCNMGWSGYSSYAHFPVESRYNTYRNAMVVEFNLDHTHSLNYEVTSSGVTTQYCYCNCNILTYDYVDHSYTDHYVDNRDNATHKAYCRCGLYVSKNHSWNHVVPYAITLPYKPTSCDQCGALKSGHSGGGTITL